MIDCQEVCDYLNDLLARDSIAMNALLTAHTPCNDALAAAPDTPVWSTNEVTPLGVLCGIGGYERDYRHTKIVAWWDGACITRFFVADDDTPSLIERLR